MKMVVWRNSPDRGGKSPRNEETVLTTRQAKDRLQPLPPKNAWKHFSCGCDVGGAGGVSLGSVGDSHVWFHQLSLQKASFERL
jgi:hypothetical protein